MPRPSKLTSEVRLTICDAIRIGATFEQACRRARVAPSTGREWRARGEGRDPRRRATTRYVMFAESVAEAERDHNSGGKLVEHEGAQRSTFGDADEPGRPSTPQHIPAETRFAEWPGTSR